MVSSAMIRIIILVNNNHIVTPVILKPPCSATNNPRRLENAKSMPSGEIALIEGSESVRLIANTTMSK